MSRPGELSGGVDGPGLAPDRVTCDAAQNHLRVTLALSRSDDPLLFDALAALDKGRRRVARLRTLAHDGLLAGIAAASSVRSATSGGTGQSATGPTQEEGRGPQATPYHEHEELAALSEEVTRAIFDPPQAA